MIGERIVICVRSREEQFAVRRLQPPCRSNYPYYFRTVVGSPYSGSAWGYGEPFGGDGAAHNRGHTLVEARDLL